MARIFGIIGGGKMVIECINHILSFEGTAIPFVIYDPDMDVNENLIEYCYEKKIHSFGFRKINSPECIDIIRSAAPDIIFSMSNFKIIKKEMIEIPKFGIINFHNGPVPLYRGLNVVSWAIFNGESSYGVSWHYVDEGIDTGAVIAQTMFDVDANETAGRLLVKCVIGGLKLFREIFIYLYNGNIDKLNQNGPQTYYSSKDKPENNGVLNFNWPFQKIDRMVRGLNYIPFKNNYMYARLLSDSTKIIVNEVSKVDSVNSNYPPGKTLKLDKEQLYIKCSDGIVSINELMDDEHESLTPFDVSRILNLKEGDIISG